LNTYLRLNLIIDTSQKNFRVIYTNLSELTYCQVGNSKVAINPPSGKFTKDWLRECESVISN
jgi:hypothetical protein